MFAERVAKPKRAAPPLVLSFIWRRGKGRTGGGPGVTGQSDTAKEFESHLVLPMAWNKGVQSTWQKQVLACLGEGEGKLRTGSNKFPMQFPA